MDSNNLGSFVAERRKKLGKSQSDLALALHYTNQSISSFEKGDTSPSITVLPSLADFLQLSLDDLLSANRDPAPFVGGNPSYVPENIRVNIVALRNSRGLSQSYEGTVLGVSRRTIIHYEKGMSSPSLDTLETLLRFYNITASAFFYENLEEKLGYPSKKTSLTGQKIALFFLMGFLAGGGLLSAILVPLLKKGSTPESSSSAPFQFNSSSDDGSSTSSSSEESVLSTSEAIPGLKKLVIITTSGQSRHAEVTVGATLTLTLYTEGTFDFTETTKNYYDITWTLVPYGQDLSSIALTEASPYPCENLTVPLGSKTVGMNFDLEVTLQSKTEASRSMKTSYMNITVYGA